MPCGKTIKCNNIDIPSSTCTNRSMLIKSSITRNHGQLSAISWPIKNMTKQLVSAHDLMIKKPLKDILNDLKGNRLTVLKIIEEFCTIISSLIFLLLVSLVLFFIRWIKHMVLKRIETLENNVDDLVHELV
jgi:hypothetical protein